jgi:DNA-binding CsgD family transcriptional regulator
MRECAAMGSLQGMNAPVSPPAPKPPKAPTALAANATDTPADLPAETPTDWLVQAADALALPLALLSAQAELIHCNAAFQRLLAQAGGPLRLQAGRLQPTAAGAAKAFTASLAAAAQGERRLLQRATEGLAGSLGPLTASSLAAVLAASHPSATTAATTDASAEQGPARVLLTLAAQALPDLDLYAAQFALSAAETRVLKSVAAGADATQVARRYGLQVASVRGHLARIRRKTGHGSQQALLMELARLPPVAPPEPPR